MSFNEDRMIETMGDLAPRFPRRGTVRTGYSPNRAGANRGGGSSLPQSSYHTAPSAVPSFTEQQPGGGDGDGGGHHHHHHDDGEEFQQPGGGGRGGYGRGGDGGGRGGYGRGGYGAPPYPGAPGYGTTPYGAIPATAPAGQPYANAVPIPPGNWGGGVYPPPGWAPGQPLPGYPQGWPPPGSPWPGTNGAPATPYGTAPAMQYDQYGNPIYNPGGTYVPPAPPQQTNGPQPTIDVTVGAAMDRGVPMATIVGCLRRRGYSTKEISGIIGACCGWS